MSGVRRVAILGSTGSIGRQALDVLAAHPDRFTVCGLAARRNVELLAAQGQRFRPSVMSCDDGEPFDGLQRLLATQRWQDGVQPRLAHGAHGLRAVAAESGADIVLAATDGLVACDAIFASVERGVDVALANKEIAVAAWEPLDALAQASGAHIIPVDSEHSAIAQCLAGERREDVRSVVLTASGGPLWDVPADRLPSVTPEQTATHPTWVMGRKNTLDSATLMNKGLEVIEACRFFGLRPSQVEVVVHRQSVAHAFAIFVDGSVKAQLAAPDMRLPIALALAYPHRLAGAVDVAPTRRALGLDGASSLLTFEPVDDERFPALRLAYRAIEAGGTAPAVLSAANEEAGRAFLQRQVSFVDIGALVAAALDAHRPQPARLPDILAADRWARSFIRDGISSVRRAP